MFKAVFEKALSSMTVLVFTSFREPLHAERSVWFGSYGCRIDCKCEGEGTGVYTSKCKKVNVAFDPEFYRQSEFFSDVCDSRISSLQSIKQHGFCISCSLPYRS